MKNKSLFTKWISLLLSLVMIFGSVPVSGIVAFAAEEDDAISIQYLSKNIVQPGVEIKIKPNDNTDDSYIGKTDEYGIWETEVLWKDLSESFYISVNGDSKKIIRSDEPKSFLIVVDDEKKWSDSAMPVAVVSVEADKTSVSRGESFQLSTTVFGTPDKYQWYFNSQKIEGATSSVLTVDNASLKDSGAYSCKVTDVNGDSRTSDSVKITVSEKTANGVTLKAYANGSEINGEISRDSVKEIELRLENLPDDANVAQVAYYVNGNCVSAGTSESSYVFEVEEGVITYTCEAEVTFDKYYEKVTVELSAPIEAPLLTPSDIEVTVDGAEYDAATGAYNVVYSASPRTKFTVAVSGESGNGNSGFGGINLGTQQGVYTCEITDEKDSSGKASTGKVARANRPSKIENKWEVSVFKAGTFTVKISKSANGVYGAAEPVYLTFNVAKATPEGFAFVTESPEAVTYNENGNKFSNPVVDGFSDVIYSIEDGDCASIDETTGELTINKAGTVTVKALLAENNNYEEATATYTLTVNKATQAIAFEEKADTIFYGQSYSRIAAPVAVDGAADGFGYNHDEGVKVEYSVVSGGEESVATVNEDGSLVFENQKTGTVTVKAVFAGNDCYEAAEAEYTLNVNEYSIENAYTISGDKIIDDGEWYTGDITITPAENHLISKTDNLGSENEWTDSIVISDEGVENGCDIYVKNAETGAISKAYTVTSEEVMLDKSAPHSFKVNYQTEAWYQEVLETVTFGYYNSVVAFTLEAEDDYSGVEYFTWKFVSDEADGNDVPETRVEALKDGETYKSEICVLGDENNLQDFRGRISFTATDYAGNTEESKSLYVIVIDSSEPELDISVNRSPEKIVNNAYPYEDADENTVDPIEIYGGDVTVTLSVIEKNFFAENAVVIVNGEDVSKDLAWIDAGDSHYAELEFDEEDDYRIALKYNDIFGEDTDSPELKKSYTADKQICIDTTPSVISLSMSEAQFERDDVKYHNGDVEATITVEDEKFRPAEIVVSDVEGYSGIGEENKAYLGKSENWTYDEESQSYSASIVIKAENADNEYAFTVSHSDLAENEAEAVESGVFVIDTVAPETVISTETEPVKTVINSYPYADAEKDAESSIDVFGDAVKVIFTIVEKNFFADRAVVTVNGDKKKVEWTTNGDNRTVEIVLDEDDDYEINLTYTDVFGEAVSSDELICIDTTPSVISLSMSEAQFERDDVKYHNGDVEATITVEDEKFRPAEIVVSDVEGYSGIGEENKAYLGKSENWTYDEESQSYSASIVIKAENADNEYAFTVSHSDLANNEAEAVESGVFVIDTVVPETGISTETEPVKTVINSYPYADAEKDVESSIDVFSDDAKIIFTVNEKNFFADRAVVTVNGDEKKVEWTSDGDNRTAEIVLDEDGDYEISLTYTDIFGEGEEKDKFESTELVSVDTTAPEISIELSGEPQDYDGVKYYNKNVVAKITVKDKKFRPAELVISDEEGFFGMSEENRQYLLDSDNWQYDEKDGSYSASVVFATENAEGIYKFAADHKDIALNPAQQVVSDSFVIDVTAPVVSVDYGEAKILDSDNLPLESLENKDYNSVTIYDNKDIVVTVTIEEKNFDPARVTAKLSQNFGEAKACEFDGEWVSDGDVHTNTITLSERDVYRLHILSADRNTNSSDEYVSPKIEISDSVPDITFDVSPESETGYYKEESVDITVKVFDEYFAQENVDIKIETVDIDGNRVELDENDIIPDYNDIEWSSDENFCNSIVLTFGTEGRYLVTVEYVNAVGVKDESVCEFVLDRTAPTHEVTYSQSVYETLLNTITFKLFNSSKSEVKITVKATDTVSGVDKMLVEYPNELTPEEYYGTQDFDREMEFTVDSEKDEKVFEQTWTVNSENASVDAKAKIKVTVTDNAGNVTAEEDRVDTKNEVAIDNISSTISMSYGNAIILDSNNVEINGFEENEKNNVTVYDRKNITVTVTVKETNFNPENVECLLSVDSAEAKAYSFDGEWTTNGTVHTNTVTISGEGVYKLTVNNTDLAENNATYTSAKMVINESKPTIYFNITPARDVDYYNETVSMDIKIFDEYFASERATITVTAADAHFKAIANPVYETSAWSRGENNANIITLTFADEGRYNVKVEYTNAVGDQKADERSFVLDLTAPVISSDIQDSAEVNNGAIFYIRDNFLDKVKSENGTEKFLLNANDYTIKVTGRDIGNKEDVVMDVTDYFQNAENWKTEWNEAESTYISSITISGFEDARYTITVNGKDKALNEAASYTTAEFIVDRSAPYDIKITYSDPVSIGTVTNGKDTAETRYYNGKIKVTLTAEDSVSGVVQFDWVYNRASDASNTNVQTLKGVCFLDAKDGTVTEETRTATVDFYLPADKLEDIRGNLTVTATDRLGNTSEPFVDKTTLVIDTVKPEIEIEYSPTDPKRSDGDYKDGGIGYYDSPVTVSVFVKDANFTEDAKSIKYTGKGVYDGAVIMCNDERYSGNWTKSGDTWRADIELPNDGSYVISAEYTDPSGNKADSAGTGTLIVDRSAPVIKVEYSPYNPINTIDGRNYFNEDQTATITITERNFNPEDIIASVTTQKIGDSNETQTDMAAALLSDSAWKKDGDNYTATIKYATDGNYKFNIEYTDPSGNQAEEYAGDEFTVDKSAPTDISFEFSDAVDEIDGTRFYDVPVKVTVTANDTISGVKAFDYTYTSSVTGKTTSKTINATANGASAKAVFYIPGEDIEQFKGTVKASATDNSGNKSSAEDGNKTLVYDNIAPEGNIDLGTAVNTANGTSYFASDVNATITIEESNFDENDVVVLVDGNQVSTGSWTNNGDVWTTNVNVSSDGQHKISVSYTDKSGNQMESKESDTFVIDHTAPVIVVSGIKNNAAYSDEEIGFTVTAQDANFSAAGLEAKLTAVVQIEGGKFVTKNIDLKNAYSSSGGYSINVSNLEEDGIYTLTCSASDLCGNSSNGISVDGKTASSVVFSVNRNGSTFDVDDNTKDLVSGKGYTQNVNGNIVVTEINVAPIETHSVKINGIELEEGVDYDVKPAGSDGEWYKYIYTIYNKNFTEENDYSIVISSTDGTKNTGYSDLKGRPINFTVDKTAPTVSVSGIEANGSYKTDKLTVSIVPFDAGGMLQKIEVFADDKPIASYSGEELMSLLSTSDGKFNVDITEGSYDRIRFVCTDEAGNVYDSDDTYKDIAISPNQLVLLWSKDWFKASVIGGTALVLGLIVFIILKKKKKEEE